MSNPFGPSPTQEIQELIEARKFAEADRKARARIASTPDDPDLHALRASALLPMGKFDIAEKELRKCIELRPHEVTPWLNYGRFLQQTNRWGDALTHYANAVRSFPGEPQVIMTFGQLLQRMGKFAEAEAAYRKAVELDPGSQSYNMLGMAQLRQDRVEDAIACFNEAISMDPQNAAAYGNLGNAEQKRGNFEAAADAYERCHELSPKDVLPFVSRGMALMKLERWKEAADIFEEVLGSYGPERRAAAWLPFVRAQELGQLPAGYRAEIGRIVARAALEVPEGYASMDEFNAALAEALSEDSSTVWEPAGKATRGGGQTGLLLDKPREPFIAFEKMLRKAIDAHFDTIRREAGHPFFGQVPESYQIDMWGTLLAEGGHQHAHIHTGGWMSGVYYVALPPVVNDTANKETKEGWIEFGAPPPDFTPSFDVETVAFEPQQGSAFFFPSYLFHRTLPFKGETPRISLAFDVKPMSWRR
ncbi:uncharacterized protein (TIGR02466 family) [Parvibaculum indicum]|uniref:tetratricopeptide repeat protein n=1 Tax=Parvibaculum indicum TaxID=562969 RepID=UPI001423B77D|nr:tetratricopeptide repeat protein [Parvibaculum indicum]NIJ40169.1 uncharacterized protein (TIGR02466 family) [Parvibaculum indicum]